MPICRVLEIAPSSFYAATTRPPSERELRDEELKSQMVQVHEENYGVYGLPKLWRQLLREGYAVANTPWGAFVRRRDAEVGPVRTKLVDTRRCLS